MGKAHSSISRIREALPSLSGTMVRIVAGGSAAMNGITAFGMLGWGGAAMLAAIDLFKPTLAPNIRNDIKNRAFGWAGVRTLMLTGLVSFSALAAYRSHFCQHNDIMAHGSAVEFVEAWLEHEAQSSDWKVYAEASRQGDLFG